MKRIKKIRRLETNTAGEVIYCIPLQQELNNWQGRKISVTEIDDDNLLVKWLKPLTNKEMIKFSIKKSVTIKI